MALTAFAFVWACGPSGSDTGDVGVDGTTDGTSGPRISSVSITQNPRNVLSAFVEFETNEPAVGRVAVTHNGEVVREVGPSEMGTEHSLFVMGMQKSSEYEFEITAETTGGATTRTQSFTTPGLPDDFPPLHVEASNPDLAADGYRLLDVFRWNDENTGSYDDWGMLIIINERGEVVWYYKTDVRVLDAGRVANGNIVFNNDPESIVEINMKGEVVNRWSASEDLGRELSNNEFGLHHGQRELANGQFVTLSTEVRQVDGYIDSGQSANVVGDVAIQFNRAGEVTNSWSMFDVLSDYTTRKRTGSTGPFWDSDYGMETNDWTHGNAVEPGKQDGTLIASLRHQDWIVNWDKQTGELQWRLGPEGDFEMASQDGEFNYHQHAPIWMENGNLLVYDNGNARPSIEPGNQYYTRVVEYDLDTANIDIEAGQKGTVEQVWSYKNPSEYYAPYVGDADQLPNGNILIGDGGLLSDPGECIGFDDQDEPVDKTGACISSGSNQKWARILEVTHDEQKRKALEVHMRDKSDQNPRSYTMYRASYIESLYPSGTSSQ
jgi:hypothetical protein